PFGQGEGARCYLWDPKDGFHPWCPWHALLCKIPLVRLDSSNQDSFITMQEAEPSEPRGAEVTKKPKAAVPSANKRPKKETKKKR
uniref:Uncharacterized protein n=1 Tax=Urocitellus parryii TaxID=9999 RepID=A0A8D2KCZ1_UROPR